MAKDEIRVKANSKKKLFTLKERRIASMIYNRYSTVCFLFLLLRFVSLKVLANAQAQIEKQIPAGRIQQFYSTAENKFP